jgi:hypothetical protein
MSSYSKRTPGGKWGKDHNGDFDVSSGIRDVSKPHPMPLRAVKFKLGDLLIELDVEHLEQINKFVAECNTRPTKW